LADCGAFSDADAPSTVRAADFFPAFLGSFEASAGADFSPAAAEATALPVGSFAVLPATAFAAGAFRAFSADDFSTGFAFAFSLESCA
jgi:hypothetical protein